jgi:hypothetical protein
MLGHANFTGSDLRTPDRGILPFPQFGNIPVFNRDVVVSLLRSIDAYSLRSLFSGLSQDLSRQFCSLQDALDVDNIRLAAEISHAMKGVALNYGAMRVAIIAADIEKFCQSRAPLDSAVEQLKLAIYETSLAINDLFAQKAA